MPTIHIHNYIYTVVYIQFIYPSPPGFHDVMRAWWLPLRAAVASGLRCPVLSSVQWNDEKTSHHPPQKRTRRWGQCQGIEFQVGIEWLDVSRDVAAWYVDPGIKRAPPFLHKNRGFSSQHSELFPFTAHLPVFVAAALSFVGIIATTSSNTAQSRRGTSGWRFPLLRPRQMLWHATFLVHVIFHFFLHPIFQWWSVVSEVLFYSADTRNGSRDSKPSTWTIT